MRQEDLAVLSVLHEELSTTVDQVNNMLLMDQDPIELDIACQQIGVLSEHLQRKCSDLAIRELAVSCTEFSKQLGACEVRARKDKKKWLCVEQSFMVNYKGYSVSVKYTPTVITEEGVKEYVLGLDYMMNDQLEAFLKKSKLWMGR